MKAAYSSISPTLPSIQSPRSVSPTGCVTSHPGSLKGPPTLIVKSNPSLPPQSPKCANQKPRRRHGHLSSSALTPGLSGSPVNSLPRGSATHSQLFPSSPSPLPPPRTKPQQASRAQAFTHACSDPGPHCSKGEPFKREAWSGHASLQALLGLPMPSTRARPHMPWAWCLSRRVRPLCSSCSGSFVLEPQAPLPTRLPICCSLRLQRPPDPSLRPSHCSGESSACHFLGKQPEPQAKSGLTHGHAPPPSPPLQLYLRLIADRPELLEQPDGTHSQGEGQTYFLTRIPGTKKNAWHTVSTKHTC